MKKVLSVLLGLVLTVCMAPSVAPADISAGESFAVPFAASAITVDGVASAGEWDGDALFTVDTSTAVLEWEGDTEVPADAATAVLSYKLRWDADYLYILETRTDATGMLYFVDEDNINRLYMGDSTLFFIQFDDGAYDKADMIDLQYAADFYEGKGSVIFKRNGEDFGTIAKYENVDMVSVIDGDTSVTEIRFRWSDLPNATGNVYNDAVLKAYVCNPKLKLDATRTMVADEWSAGFTSWFGGTA